MRIRNTAVLLTILILLLRFSQPGLAQSQATKNVTLYLHTAADGNAILNADPSLPIQQATSIRRETVFMLRPPLGASARLVGTISITLVLRAESGVTGTLQTFLAERRNDGGVRELHARTGFLLGLDSRLAPFTFLIPINATLQKGSTIDLHVLFNSESIITVQLVWDDSRAPSSVTIPVLEPLKIDVAFFDETGRLNRIFAADSKTAGTRLQLRINLTDTFGSYRLREFRLTITRLDGSAILDRMPLTNMSSRTASTHSLLFRQNMTLPIGHLTAAISGTDTGENEYTSTQEIYIALFHIITIAVTDSLGRPLKAALIVFRAGGFSWSGETNSTGWTKVLVASSDVVGTYELLITWNAFSMKVQKDFVITYPFEIRLTLPGFDYILIVNLYGFGLRLPGVRVDLIAPNGDVTTSTTFSNGTVRFTQVPAGVYTVRVHHFLIFAHDTTVVLGESRSDEITVPFPLEGQLPYIGVAIAAVGAVAVVRRTRKRTYPTSFAYLNEITKGGIPEGYSTLVLGNSGSGKSAITESFAYAALSKGNPCIYVTNVEFPSRVRGNMKQLGMPCADHETKRKLVFVDCYSSLAGEASPEKHSVNSITDLTGLGIQISRVLEELGEGTNVCFDSLTTLLQVLKTDYALAFLQAMSAKVQSLNGRLFATVGTSADRTALSKLEESHDCVIELQLVEGRAGQRRRLRVKKMRGRGYEDRWTRFTVEDGKGIVFYSPKPQP